MPDSIGTAFVSIRPQLDTFKEELQAGLDSAMADVGNRTVRIDADTAEADLKIDETDVKLDKLGAKTATPEVRIDSSGLGEADTDLQRVNADLDATSSKADRAAQSFGGGGQGIGLLSALVPLAPALAEVGVVGGGALSAIAVAGGAAALGLGAFALAAGGELTEVKTEAQGLLSTWQATTEGFTEPVIQEAVGLLPGVFRLLTPAVESTSGALLGLEQRIATSLGSPFLSSFSRYIAGEGGTAITSFGNLIGGLGHAFAGFAEGMAPEIARIDSDLTRWGTDLAHFGDTAASGGLTGLMSYLATNGPRVAATLESVGTDMATLARDAAPLGPVLLTIVGGAARLLGDLESLNPELVTWALGLGAAAYGANKLLGPLGGLSGAARLASGALSDMSNFGGIANGAETAVGPVGKLAAGLGASAGAADGVAVSALSLISPLALAAGSAAVLGAAYVDLASHENDAKAADEAAAQSFVTSFVSTAQASGDTTAQVESLITAQMKQIATQEYLSGTTFKQTDEVHLLGNALSALTASSAGSAAATGLLNAPALTAAQSEAKLTTALQTANAAFQQSVSLLNSMESSGLSAEQANTAFQAAVQTLTDSLKTNGTSMDASTAKGLANRQAWDGVTSSMLTVIQNMQAQGKTSDQIVSKTSALTGYVEAMGAQYHLTAGQVTAMLTQIGLTPAQVTTELIASGYVKTGNDAATAAANMKKIPPKTHAQLIAEGFTEAQIAAYNLTQSLDGLNGKVTTVTLDQVIRTIEIGGAPQGPSAGLLGSFTHATGLLSGAMGEHAALVGEQGPELMTTRGGALSMLGAAGPEVRTIPAGASILSARDTARISGHADGINLGGLSLTLPVPVPVVVPPPAITLTDQRTVSVTVGDVATMSQVTGAITVALDNDRQATIDAIGQLVGG